MEAIFRGEKMSDDTGTPDVTPPVEAELAPVEVEPMPVKAEPTPLHLMRFLYNSNPFYLISAAIVLYAETVVFRTGALDRNALVPLGLNAAFTALLAGTSIFIVRWGRVWDDARSIFMCVLLLLMTQSIGSDSELLDGDFAGRAYLTAGFFFSLGVIESIRRGLNIRFPRGFLIGVYSVLGAFFAWPLLLAELILRYPDTRTPSLWGILAFPVAAALLFALGFLPAARCGSRCAEGSNTPWRAPLFPWSAAVMLWVGILLRTYLMTLSFHAAHGELGNFGALESGFGLYMLLPPALAALLLIVEYRKADRAADSAAVVLLPALLLLLAITPGRPSASYREFYQLVFCHGFTPAALVFSSIALFYGYARLRGFRECEGALAVTLFLALLFRVGPSWFPAVAGIGALALLFRFLLRWNNTFMRVFFTVAAVLFAGWLGRNQLPAGYNWLVPLHAGVAAVMGIALCGRELECRDFRRLLGFGWLAFLLVMGAFVFGPHSRISIPQPYLWLGLEFGMGVAYCLVARDRFLYWILAAYGALAAGILIWFGYREVKHLKGLMTIFWAALFFIAAFLISLRKGWKKKRDKSEGEKP